MLWKVAPSVSNKENVNYSLLFDLKSKFLNLFFAIIIYIVVHMLQTTIDLFNYFFSYYFFLFIYFYLFAEDLMFENTKHLESIYRRFQLFVPQNNWIKM